MRLDVPRAHATGVQGDDLVIEAGKPARVLGDQQRIELAIPVTRNIQHHAVIDHRDRFLRIAVAVIAGRLLIIVIEMNVHLGRQHTFRQSLLQFSDQAIVAEQCRAVFAALQQLVNQFVFNRGLGASCHEILLGPLSWLNTQNFLHPPNFESGPKRDANDC